MPGVPVNLTGGQPLVYDQCAQHEGKGDEVAAGFGGAAYASVANSEPYSDFRMGGTR